MRVAGYARVSTDDQATRGFSLDAQRQAIERYAEGRGWSITGWYIDAGVSAYNDDPQKRPQFAALLDAVGRREWDAAIVLKLDRLARSVRVSASVLGHFRDKGCALISVSEGWDFGSISGQFLYHIMGALAEMESATISERTKRGMAMQAAKGLWRGTVPWGGTLAEGKLIVDPARADDVAWALEAMAQQPFSTVATAFNVRGLRTARGNLWRPLSVQQWLEHADWLLTQPDPWPRLLAAARARPRFPHSRRDLPVYDLTGIVRCACGGRIASGGTQRDGNSGMRCHHYTPERPSGAGCPYRRSNRWHYEALATAWLLGLPDLSDAALVAGDDDAVIAERRAAIATRRRNLGLALADDALPLEIYQERIAALAAEEAALPPSRATVEGLGAGIKLAQERWGELLPPARNAFYRATVDYFLITGYDLTVVPKPGLAMLLAAHQVRENAG